MKKQWKLDNKGMTLLEVIVAFAIFAIAATILITGFNGALKVMGNSEAIKDASQKNASGLEISGSPLEEIEGVTVKILDSDPKQIEFGKNKEYKISGVFQTATSKKQNDETEMSLKMFEPDTKVLVTPTVPTPEPTTPTPPPINPDDWIHLNGGNGGKLVTAGSGNEKPYYSYVSGDSNPGKQPFTIADNTKGDVYIYVKKGSTLRLNSQEGPAYPPNIIIILEDATSKVVLGKFSSAYSLFVIGRYSEEDKMAEVSLDKAELVTLKGNIVNAKYEASQITFDGGQKEMPEIPQNVWDSIAKLSI